MLSILKDKKIILGITGSIAAYKSALLVRELRREGAEVHCVATPHALQFVTPVTLANLSRNKVISEMFDSEVQSGGAWHIELAHECDMMLIAPCSATTLGKLAHGICDNSLVTLAIAKPQDIPFVISPAMDSTMWLHKTTQRNIEILKNDGAYIIQPVSGELSSGLIGPGRFPEIADIIKHVKQVFEGNYSYSSSKSLSKSFEDEETIKLIEKPLETLQETIEKDEWNVEIELEKLKKIIPSNLEYLKGKSVLITAGPTYEKIDAVRYIANKSSGKMGFAIAEIAHKAGAKVFLISGPVNLKCSEGISRIDVTDAKEMYDEAMAYFDLCDIAILSAAVADFTVKHKSDGKIKKDSIGTEWNLELIRTKDILKEFGEKKSHQLIIGFSLESEKEIENGWKKLKNKNANMIVVNSSNQEKGGFGKDFNAISLLSDKGDEITFETMSKEKCAIAILENAGKYLEKELN